MRVKRLKPSVHGSVEHHVASCYHSAAPSRKHFLHAPCWLCRHRVPCTELATISAGSRIHSHVFPNERRSSYVIRLNSLRLKAQIIVRQVDEACPGRKCGWLPIFSTRRGGTDIADRLEASRLI